MNESTHQQNTIISYLRNQMDDNERNAFEIELLEDPELLNAVQREEALIRSLNDQDTVEQILSIDNYASSSSSTKNNVVNFSDWISQPLSIAASLLIAVGVVLISSANVDNDFGPVTDSGISPIRSSVILETMRSNNAPVALTGRAPMLINIDVGPAAAGEFEISIINDQSGNEVAYTDELELTEPGMLQILLNNDLSGEFTVYATSNETGSVLSYSIVFTN